MNIWGEGGCNDLGRYETSPIKYNYVYIFIEVALFTETSRVQGCFVKLYSVWLYAPSHAILCSYCSGS